MIAEGEYLREVRRPTDLKRILEFEVPRERVEKEIQGIIEGIRKGVSLPGFRRGKAPAGLIRAKYAGTARKEAIEKLVPEAYRRALEKESLRPVLPAEISNMEYGDEGPLRFHIEIELFPAVEIKQYKGIKVKRESKPVEDEAVDREIEGLRERFAGFDELDRRAEPEDTVIADYSRLGPDSKAVRGTKVSGYPFELSAPGLLKEFKEALVGLKAGDRKTVEVNYPDDFSQEEMRGKKVSFLVEVKKIGRRSLPELNEEFAKMLGVDSMEVVKEKVRKGLEEARDEEVDSRLKRDILNKVIEKSDFEVPEGLVGMALDSIIESYDQSEKGKADPEKDEKIKEARGRLRPLAVNVVKEQFIIDDIAEREGITVEDAEIEGIIGTVATRAGISVDEARRKAAESDEISRWRRDILKNKVLDFLKEQAEVEE
jgi:trigger factor